MQIYFNLAIFYLGGKQWGVLSAKLDQKKNNYNKKGNQKKFSS